MRKSDATLLAAIVMGVAHSIPAEKLTNSAAFLKLMTAIPDSVAWALAGVSMGAWLFYPWKEKPRSSVFWERLTAKFVIEHLHAGQWHDAVMGITPQTDIQVRLRLRFIRSGRFKLRVRLYACTGQGRQPMEHVIDLGKHDVVNGQKMDIPLVDLAIPTAGWDHTRKRGWGPDKDQSFIGKSRNVAIIECQGRTTQRHRIYVEMVNHDVGQQQFTPSIYLQEEDDDIWDVTANSRTGIWKW